MRAKEFLIEKINLTGYTYTIFNKILEVIDHDGDYINVPETIDKLQQILTETLNDIILKEYPDMAEFGDDQLVRLFFDENIPHGYGGFARQLDIHLPRKQILDLVMTHRSGKNIQQPTHQLVSILLHELTHVIQHLMQYRKNRQKTQYRSYAGTDEELRKEIKSGKLSLLYFSSPQEIAAYAHTFSTSILKWLERDRLPDNLLDLIKKHLDHYMERSGYTHADLPKKVFRRYVKKTYEELREVLTRNATAESKEKNQAVIKEIMDVVDQNFEYFKQTVPGLLDELYDERAPDNQVHEQLVQLDDELTRDTIVDIRNILKSHHYPTAAIKQVTGDIVNIFSNYSRFIMYDYELYMNIEDADNHGEYKSEFFNELEKIHTDDLYHDQQDMIAMALSDAPIQQINNRIKEKM